MAPVLYTCSDVANRLGVSIRTVWSWIQSGQLKALKMPGMAEYRVRDDELTDFILRKFPAYRIKRKKT